MQFIDRMFLVFMPVKHQPDYLYLRHVPLKKVHLFTAIQFGSLAALWIIKSTPASLIFPLMVSIIKPCSILAVAKNLINLQVLALVGFRKAMDYFPSVFSQKELFWLDNLMPASNKKEKKRSSTHCCCSFCQQFERSSSNIRNFVFHNYKIIFSICAFVLRNSQRLFCIKK